MESGGSGLDGAGRVLRAMIQSGVESVLRAMIQSTMEVCWSGVSVESDDSEQC